MLDLGTLSLGMKVDGAETAKAQLDGVKDSSKTVSEQFDNVKKTTGNALKGIAAVGTAATAGGAAIFGLATKAASSCDNIDKMSQRLGLSRQAFQEWDYVLSQSGVDINSMKIGFKTLTNTIGQVSEAGTTAGTAFDTLGISIDDVKGKSQDEIFSMVITQLQGLDDQTQKATLAQQLFGRSGQEMLPLLNSSAEATEALKQKARDYGLVLSDEAVNAGVAFTDNMDTMHRKIEAVTTNLGASFMPIISNVCDYIGEHMPQIQATITNIADKVSTFINFVMENGDTIISILAGIGAGFAAFEVAQIITAVVEALLAMTKAEKGLSIAQAALNLVMNANPIGIIITLIATVVAAIIGFIATNDKAKAKIQEAWNAVKNAFTNVINAIKNGLSTAISKVTDFVSSVKTKFDSLKSNLTNAAKNAIKGLLNGFKNAFGAVKSWIQSKIQWIKDKFNSVKDIFSKLTGGGDEDNGKKHRRGLREVPYDNYNAILHKGEMVLTAAEANQYQKNKGLSSSADGTSYNVVVNNYSPKALSEVETAREYRRVQRSIAYGF